MAMKSFDFACASGAALGILGFGVLQKLAAADKHRNSQKRFLDRLLDRNTKLNTHEHGKKIDKHNFQLNDKSTNTNVG